VFIILILHNALCLGGELVEYSSNAHGLFPMAMQPNSGSSKQREQRVKKFELIGRLTAQTLLDARIVCFVIYFLR
jgi:hypothetical protein